MTRADKTAFFAFALLAALCFPPAAAAGLWTPVGCSPVDAARYAEAKRRIVEAGPGDEEYVPHPYPKTARHAVEDFLHTYREMVTDDAGRMPADDRRFFERVARGRLRAVVATVANWTAARCGHDRRTDFYFLVRFFDRASGREVLRGASGDSGAVGLLAHLDDSSADEVPTPRLGVPDLAAAREAARARLGRKVTDAQLVATWGDVRCGPLVPCVALRAGGSTYLLRGDELWRIADERLYASMSEIRRARTTADGGMVLCHPCEPDDCFVTVGGDAMAALLPVEH